MLPALFEKMEFSGSIITVLFFTLMTIAAVTSSISMLEVPVAYATERHKLNRKTATYLVGTIILLVSALIMFNFTSLFGLVISFTTKFSEPIIGLLFCVFVGWVWSRQQILAEIKLGMPNAEQGLFWRVWPNYIKFVCPIIMCLLFWQTLLSN